VQRLRLVDALGRRRRQLDGHRLRPERLDERDDRGRQRLRDRLQHRRSQSQNASASGNFTVHLTPVGSSGCPSGEVPSVKVGFALAEGCFKETHAGSKVFDTTKGAFVGGFLLTPKPGGKLRLRNDIAPARLEELGPGVDLVVHGAAHAFPAEAIPVGFAQADLNNNGTASGLQLVGDAVMKGFGFSSFPLKFGLKVKWATDGRSSTITGDLKIDDLWKAFGRTAPPLSAAGLPIGNASFGGVSGSVEWKATNGFGFDLSSVKVKGSKLGVLVGDPPQLLGISAYTLSITGFNSGVPTLEGSADISIPRSSSSGGQKPLVLGGRLKFVGSSFGGAGLKLDGLNKPIADTGVFFQGIVGDLDVRPAVGFRLGGLFTLLPPINGETIAEGTVELRGLSLAAGCTSGQKPIEIHTSITSGILEHHGIGELSADGSNCMYFGKFGVESVTSWDIGLDAGGFKKVMEAQGKLQGFIGTAGMNLEGGADLTLPFVPGTIGGNFLVSSTGFAACVRLTSFIQGGFGRAWTDPSPPQTFTACDLSPWRVSAGPRAAAVGTPHTVVVRSGLPVAGFLARGQAGPPRVKLLGPNGESFTAPADGHLVKTGAVVIATSKPERAVYFFVRKPAGGSWRIVDLDAHGLPDPRLKAHVSGKRSHRVLHYSLKARPGLKVQFEEAAGGILKPLGAPRSAAHGAIAFKPLVVRSKRHQIRALLSQDGIPQTDKVVAHFSLTPPGKPGKVKHLKATRTKTTLGVRFGAPRNAVRYLVVVSAGRAATFRTIITKTHLTVTGVPAKAKLSVSVTPENANDLRGPTARVKVR